MDKIIAAIILGLISLLCLIFGIRQFMGIGFLFNNAYIYASKEDREKMDTKPYYRQSGIVFCLIGLIFAINALDAILQSDWLFFCVIGVVICTLVYAIASTGKILKKDKNKDEEEKIKK